MTLRHDPAPGLAPAAERIGSSPAPVPVPSSIPFPRAIAPDASRGLMLLVIAVANCVAWMYGRDTGLLARPLDGGVLDTAVNVASALFVDNRGYPMFAFLFGYGIHQLATRERARGRSGGSVFGLLAKRNAWLLAIGILHGVLLFFGDIMSIYAVAALMALIWLQRAPTWVLWGMFVLSLPIFAWAGAGDAGAMAFPGAADSFQGFPSNLAPTYLDSIVVRATQDFGPNLPWLPFAAFSLLPPMLLGLIVARTRVLERPWEHLRLAAWLGWSGLALAILGGLPFAYGLAFGAEPDPSWMLAGVASNVTGLAAGAGFPCLIALGVARLERRRLADPLAPTGPILGALAALGRRSMSGYLAQSLGFAILMPAWGLGLGAVLGTAGASAIGAGIWLFTVLGAVLLERAGKPGPAEWVHRRLTYGPRR